MANVNIGANVDPNADPNTLLKQLHNAYNVLTEELTFLLGNLDTRNVNELNAEVVTAGSITGDKIQAGTVTADKITVAQLSSISADVGHILAGLIESVEILGSYIATSRGYPRVEMSNTLNMMGAYRSSDNHIQIYSPSEMFSPVIKFQTPMGEGYIFFDANTGALTINSNDSDIKIRTSKRVDVDCSEGFFVNGSNVS